VRVVRSAVSNGTYCTVVCMKELAPQATKAMIMMPPMMYLAVMSGLSPFSLPPTSSQYSRTVDPTRTFPAFFDRSRSAGYSFHTNLKSRIDAVIITTV
jgi:hypothetical protein